MGRGDAGILCIPLWRHRILDLAACRRHLPGVDWCRVRPERHRHLVLGLGQSGSHRPVRGLGDLRERSIEVATHEHRCLEYFAGFTGLNSGPGWRDTPPPGYNDDPAFLVLGAGPLLYGHAR